MKEKRTYRIVIKFFHHSTNTNDIKELLQHEHVHKVRNTITSQHRITKEPLNLFFVNLKPAANKKEVIQGDFKIKSLKF